MYSLYSIDLGSFLLVFSKLGSFKIGFSSNKLCIEINNEFNVWTELHFGPGHVPIIDKHTLPFSYKLGLNLIFPFIVSNLAPGWIKGYLSGISIVKKKYV